MNHTSKQLDFLVIGAQKCGTTTLHKLLDETDCIFVPKEKEAPFFTRREELDRGWPTFYKEVFATAPPKSLKGKVTPQYMTSPDVPAYIFNEMPNVKLVAILRNPIARLKSQYKMLLRRGMVTVELDELIKSFFNHPERWEAARNRPAGPDNEVHCLVPWSEYGRILSNYLKYFPRENILILFQEDLATTPSEVFYQLTRHLGLTEASHPPSLNKRFHVGGRDVRFSRLRELQKTSSAQLIKKLLHRDIRRKVKFWLDQFNNLPDNYEAFLSNESSKKLIKHFSDDTEKLTELFEICTPWK